MDCNYAAHFQDIVLREESYHEYLPQPVIPHRHSRFLTQTRVAIDASATLLYSEILMPGRKYFGPGELFEYDLFSATVRAERPDGGALFVEKFTIEPHRADIRLAGVMGAFDVFANVLLLTPKEQAERIFGRAESVLDLRNEFASGASRLPGEAGLIYKVLGVESQPVRAKVREFWSLVRREVVGRSVPKEFLWA
jgi:urease accessory protein